MLTSQFFESGYGESVASAPTAYHFTSPSSSFDSPTYNLAASSYDASLPTSYAQKSSDPVSRFFGVTTTQSNDLQVRVRLLGQVLYAIPHLPPFPQQSLPSPKPIY